MRLTPIINNLARRKPQEQGDRRPAWQPQLQQRNMAPPEGEFEFPASVDDVQAVPQEYRGLYKKGENGFSLDEKLAKRMDVSALTGSLRKERQAKTDLEKLVKGFRELGLGDTPEEALAAIKAAQEGGDDEEGGDEGGKLSKIRAKHKQELEEAVRKAVGQKDEQLARMDRALRKNMVEREAVAALAKHKGSEDLLLPHVASRLKLIEEDGEFVVRVVDRDGDVESDGRGEPKTVDALVAEMRADAKFSRAFEGSGKGGGGAQGVRQVRREGGDGGAQMSSQDKISQGLRQLHGS